MPAVRSTLNTVSARVTGTSTSYRGILVEKAARGSSVSPQRNSVRQRIKGPKRQHKGQGGALAQGKAIEIETQTGSGAAFRPTGGKATGMARSNKTAWGRLVGRGPPLLGPLP